MVLSVVFLALVLQTMWAQLFNLEAVVRSGQPLPTRAASLRFSVLSEVPPPETGRELPRRLPHTAVLTEIGQVVFIGTLRDSFPRQGIFVSDGLRTAPLLLAGDTSPGQDTDRFASFRELAAGPDGDIVFVGALEENPPREGVFLLSRSHGIFFWLAGSLRTISLEGYAMPGFPDQQFATYDNLESNERGDALFRGVAAPAGPARREPQGIFRFDTATHLVRCVAVSGTPAARMGGRRITSVSSPSLNRVGAASYTATLESDLLGDALPPRPESVLYRVGADGSMPMAFTGQPSGVPGSARIESIAGFVRLVPDTTVFRVPVLNGGFEQGTTGGLPRNWQIFWTNGGRGEAFWVVTPGRRDAFEGTGYLRIHAGPGGGAAFILSDPIAVRADYAYELTAQLRYALSIRGDEVSFTVLQYNAAGRIVAEHHSVGRPGDNSWQWQARTLAFATTPQTITVRIRFGLVTRGEAYFDVDAVR